MNRKEKAIELFKKDEQGRSYNCAQAVICAYSDKYGIDEEIAFRLLQGFGGGMGGNGHVCGAVSGMVAVASLATCPKLDLDNTHKVETYQMVTKMLRKFEEKQGYLNCADLKKYKDKTIVGGKLAGCVKCVEDCCDIIEELIGD